MSDQNKHLTDDDLLRAARNIGCNDPLMQQLADRVEALRGGMAAIKMNPSLHSCQMIATLSLDNAR
ncbi:hypothetical protein [Sulfitobacter dubius]|uniref:Uncharacterized protein n=1 Tax=Sulfitobacter dubius TaxID=218673 RepID=A0ABY3ZIH7_9RHOB|nr:hypothetical protein [Sulfitobacter dubius]UOA14479.1 hypothetical protein DSM109990_01285 [Sulfitobacter dubius]